MTLGKLTNASHATIALDGSASHAATMTVTGTAQNTGTINLTDGTLTVGGAISGTGTYNLGAGAALALLGGGSLTGAINGFGTLEIEGTKTVSITHTAVLGVPTVIQAGKVALAASVAFTNAAGHTWDINGPTGVTETCPAAPERHSPIPGHSREPEQGPTTCLLHSSIWLMSSFQPARWSSSMH